jgi:hypothetical protein
MHFIEGKKTQSSASTMVLTAAPDAVKAQLVHMMIAKGINLETHNPCAVSFGMLEDGAAFPNGLPGGSGGKVRHRYTFALAPMQGGTSISVSGEILRPTRPGNYLRSQLAPNLSMFSEWLEELRNKFVTTNI